MSNTQLSYKDAGVDIHAGNELVERIKADVKRTRRPEVMGGLGGFGALCALPTKYKEPILVSGTDGVGTKLRLAIDLNKHDVVKGIADGCAISGCALVGGETAEMPGMYHVGDYDLAGFCVGVVEKSEIIDGSTVKVGDVLVALASSGPHSNGYSLIRKVLEVSGANPAVDQLEGKPLSEHLLAPTKIYVKSVLELVENTDVHAIAHLTGGGFWENIPRVLPENTKAVIDEKSWAWPAIFNWLQEKGNISRYEMYRTFNCGVGMVIAVPAAEAEKAVSLLIQAGETAWVIGKIEALGNGTEQVEIL